MLSSLGASLMLPGEGDGGRAIPLVCPSLVLGRSGSNEVVIDKPGVSRKHALITETSAGYAIRDLDSTNGTYVNLYRICQAEHTLRDGDRISLGGSDVTLIFNEGSAENHQPQAAALASPTTEALRAL